MSRASRERAAREPARRESSPQPAGEGRLVVGLVRGLHGLRGAVRVEVLTDEAGRFEPGKVLFIEGSVSPLTLAEVRRDGPGLVVRFEELRDRAAAEALRDSYLETDSPASLPEGTYFWHEIEGCQVVTTAGEQLGTVAEVIRVGEAEVYLVRGPRGEVLVPAVHSVVVELAPREGRLVVDAEALGLEAADEQ